MLLMHIVAQVHWLSRGMATLVWRNQGKVGTVASHARDWEPQGSSLWKCQWWHVGLWRNQEEKSKCVHWSWVWCVHTKGRRADGDLERREKLMCPGSTRSVVFGNSAQGGQSEITVSTWCGATQAPEENANSRCHPWRWSARSSQQNPAWQTCVWILGLKNANQFNHCN